MKVCVAGLGAVGGLVAARLALAGHEVSALARGATLAAVRERGLALTTSQGERRVARIEAAGSAAELRVPELLIVAFKGAAFAADAKQLAPLIGPRTIVLPMMNGVPCVASALPGVRQPVMMHGMGRVAKIGDPDDLAACLLEVLDHPDKYRGDTQAIRKTYDPDSVAAEYEKLFQHLLKKGR